MKQLIKFYADWRRANPHQITALRLSGVNPFVYFITNNTRLVQALQKKHQDLMPLIVQHFDVFYPEIATFNNNLNKL